MGDRIEVQEQDADFRARIVVLLPRLRRFCAALTRNGDAGDDLCQATVERALTRAEMFEAGTRLDSWMYRIARNLQIDMARRTQTRGFEVDVEDAFDIVGVDGVATVEGRSEMARAEAAMARLPDDQRVLLALVVIDGQSYKEAADFLEIPIGTVMSRIARARRAIHLAVRGSNDG
jgi:RNA polymerase sigma-70 factor, ECF subfamily